MQNYYSWLWWKCDNAPTTITTNNGDGSFCVLTYYIFHVWLHGTLDLSHFRDERDRDGGAVIRILGTVNSIQLVLISAMERKRKKQQAHRVLQQWNELLMSESLSNQPALDVENIKSGRWKTYDWNELYQYLKAMKSLLDSDQIVITGWWLFDDIWCVIHSFDISLLWDVFIYL